MRLPFKAVVLFAIVLGFLLPAFAQDSGTSNDLFIMVGTDFVRPSLGTRANLNIGLGHTFAALKKNPFGDEVTFSYTYENGGSHGFFHTDNGSHTWAPGLMKNFSVPKTKRLTGYTWVMAGMTSMTGGVNVQNRLYNGEALGGIIHFNRSSSIWVQEMFNKVVTVPWYVTTSIGYTRSW